MNLQKKILYKILFLLPIVVGCNSKKIFLHSGDVYSTGYYGYCNDSLGIYTKVFGGFR